MKLKKVIKVIWNKGWGLYYDRLCPTEMISLSELFVSKNPTRYHHIPCALRYLVIEEYYGYGKGNSSLYRKTGRWDCKEDEEKDFAQFYRLIQSVEEHGYDVNSIIYVDTKGNCFNGTHRLALCAWFGVKKIKVKRINRRFKYSTKEEISNLYGMSKIEFEKVLEAYDRLRTKIMEDNA